MAVVGVVRRGDCPRHSDHLGAPGDALHRRQNRGPCRHPLACGAARLGTRLGIGRRLRIVCIAKALRTGRLRSDTPDRSRCQPTSTGNFRPDQRRVILVHELAHLAAHDPAWQLVADLGRRTAGGTRSHGGFAGDCGLRASWRPTKRACCPGRPRSSGGQPCCPGTAACRSRRGPAGSRSGGPAIVRTSAAAPRTPQSPRLGRPLATSRSPLRRPTVAACTLFCSLFLQPPGFVPRPR